MTEHAARGIESAVISLIAQATNGNPAHYDASTSLARIGLDSLSLNSIVARIEAITGIELGSYQLMNLFNASVIGDIVTLLCEEVPREKVGALSSLAVTA